ncbi:MAG TPA: HAMP domain-containing sensor histidine kinase [Solirubrobacterales bacterium]|nr:HAMP domain-containing sensor histidine kinase [Solirubrobacterales bacterium]
MPGRLRPRNWPVRWRLAATSAGLTFVILLIFGAVIGGVATERIRSDFEREVDVAAQTLAAELRIVNTPTGSYLIRGPGLDDFALPNDATVRVFGASGALLTQNTGAADLGPPDPGQGRVSGMQVSTARIGGGSGGLTGYVQYARNVEHLDSTVTRLWIFILAGVLGGTLLASLAGATIAARAMRPISSLTATARKIAVTGDASRHMPAPRAEDEVGELAATLEQMLRSLDAARAEREAALRRQREFVADASHELRTPLTSILANLELLQAGLEDPEREDERAMVDSALRSSGRMSRLVGDLLLLAHADAGRIGARTRCDLAEAAGNAAAEVAPTAGERQLRIENDRPLPVDGNPDELHRMVLNLLDNAIRHTPPGSTVEMRLRAEGPSAVLEVADDGPGVPPELREQVFERFARGDGSADTSAPGGSGLGLAIVRAVAASHGGSAEVGVSGLGGAFFRVRLPLAGSQREIVTTLDQI